MPSDKPQLKTYIDKEYKAKFSYIAKSENRSDSNLLETVVLKYLSEYEAIHGELIINEDGIACPKHICTNDKTGKSSTSKVG